MQEDFEAEAKLIDQLSNQQMNERLVSALDKKLAQHPDKTQLLLTRANLLRKTGLLAEARKDYQRYLDQIEPTDKLSLPKHTISPIGMKSYDGNETPPVVILDDFMNRGEMSELLKYAQESEALFRKAVIGNEDPQYDPDKRETLVFYPFQKSREYFKNFAKDQLDFLCEGLGVEKFDVSKVELKMTNHVDGGFFKTHSDNSKSTFHSGRAITWLYYFSSEPAKYTGGDLYLFDSNHDESSYAPNFFTKVKAIPNRLVAFPSSFYHCVSPMKSVSTKFGDGRFAISSHISKTAHAGYE